MKKILSSLLVPIFAPACFLAALLAATPAQAQDIAGPPGSGRFGTLVTTLPNGNFVVTDPGYDLGAVQDVGAVHLYNGTTLALISTLTGSTANDRVGVWIVQVLTGSSNFVVPSPYWNGNRGAATWVNGSTGLHGVVGIDNSLVGSIANDLENVYIYPLVNGNYVVSNPSWDNGPIINAGAVTWGSGTVGVKGMVNANNSLVGSFMYDQIGYGGITVLSNGNFVVKSSEWSNNWVAKVGAVTLGSGTMGVTGTISTTNSLVGSTANDQVGNYGVIALTNGNYIVCSGNWDNGQTINAGAVTWGNGTTGVKGTITVSNSLVGSTAFDQVGSYGYSLANGNYVVCSSGWDNGPITDAGAATWGDGTNGTVGIVSVSNSIVGNNINDAVGNGGVAALTNGNYVVRSVNWNAIL
jgi:Repeat of unknown function (DUF5650)